MLLLFCLIGTVIDLIIEEKKELKAAKNLSHKNDDETTESVTTESVQSGFLADDGHALIPNDINNLTHNSGDNGSLHNVQYPTFPGSGNPSNISNRLILILTKLCSKLF